MRWRQIPGWHYEVSDTGLVRNQKSGRICRGSPDWKGYIQVGLRRPGERQRMFMMHRLVLEAFVAPCPKGHQANHLNGVKGDNRAENLEWVTGSENMLHAFSTGLHAALRGSDNGNSKLTPDEVRAMRKKAGAGVRTGLLAREYGVCPSNVRRIIRRDSWTNV